MLAWCHVAHKLLKNLLDGEEQEFKKVKKLPGAQVFVEKGTENVPTLIMKTRRE